MATAIARSNHAQGLNPTSTPAKRTERAVNWIEALHHDLYACLSAIDLGEEPPDPFWESALERYGPLDPAITAGPRRYAKSYDTEGRLPSFEVYQGDALEVLKLLASQAVVHTVVTSPPYYKLKRYGDRHNQEELGSGSIDHYLDSLCNVFDAVPLHPRGSVWVIIGDTRDKRGSLLGVPARFLVAMQDRGWMVADHVVWAKVVALPNGETIGNCMTEPAPGRLNGNGHEAVFRFVRGQGHRLGGLRKIQDAWSDPQAVAIPRRVVVSDPSETRYMPKKMMSVVTSVEGRVLPNVWRIPTGQTPKEHFAVFPAALSERPIAMTAPLSVCNHCGRPRERLVEKVAYDDGRPPRRMGKYSAADALGTEEAAARSGRKDIGRTYVPLMPVTTGWSSCSCGWDFRPGLVLDPFAGTSSVGYSALLMGRNYIGIDLYSEYCQLSGERCQAAIDLLRENDLFPSQLQR